MKVLIIDNGTIHLENLKKLLSGNSLTVLKFFSGYPSPSSFDLIVLSGGSTYEVAEHPEKFKKEIDLVKNSPVPVVGVCEGCEIIAYGYGSELYEFGPKEKGIKSIKFLDNNLLDTNGNVDVFEAHHWAIKKLGPDLTGIAKSEHGWEMIKVKDKDIYGFQFHPEMLTDKLIGDDIFRKVIRKCLPLIPNAT